MLAYTRCTRDVVFSGPLRQTQTSRMYLWQRAAYRTHEDHECIQNVYVENHPIKYSTILYTHFCKVYGILNFRFKQLVVVHCLCSCVIPDSCSPHAWNVLGQNTELQNCTPKYKCIMSISVCVHIYYKASSDPENVKFHLFSPLVSNCLNTKLLIYFLSE